MDPKTELIQAHEAFHHSDDRGAFVVGYYVEDGVDLVRCIHSDDNWVRTERGMLHEVLEKVIRYL